MIKKDCKKENKSSRVHFDPPIKPRYIPGQVSDIEDKIDFTSYKRHRLRMANMKAVVDNKAPKFLIETYYDRDKMRDDALIAYLLYKKNLDLTKKLNYVTRMGGKVDCWNDCKLKHKNDKTDGEKENSKQIMKVNKILYERVNSLTSELSPCVMAKEWKIVKEQIRSKSRLPFYKTVSKYPSITKNVIAPLTITHIRRRKCYFDLELGECKLGRMIFELYTDYVPSICANFEAFCKGFNGLSYKGTPFHRIQSGYYCQGGDVTKFNGTGGASIYEEPIPDENFTLKHSCPGVLTTCSDDKSTCDSKFNLTFRPLKTMDGKRIVFGKVVKGIDILPTIDAQGAKFGKPLQRTVVSHCGIVPLKKKNSKRNSKESKKSEGSAK